MPSKFTHRCHYHSMNDAKQFLSDELERLHAVQIVLSTNVELRLDGSPYSNRPTPLDPWAAVYFKLKGKDVSLACDKWIRVECNIWAIAEHIESLRGQERWGVGNLAQAFAGYVALPERSQMSEFEILGLTVSPGKVFTAPEIITAYRAAALKAHPDHGGSTDEFHRVKQAADNLLATIGRKV